MTQATTENTTGERLQTDEQVCPDYAAMSQFYALLIACVRNGGVRTCHTFRGVSLERFGRMIKIAENEGFRVFPRNEDTLSVERRG